MRPRSILLIIVLIAVLAGAWWLMMRPAPREDLGGELGEGRVVARVGEAEILEQALRDRAWHRVRFAGTRTAPEATEEDRRLALEDLIEYELLKAEAVRSGIILSDDEVSDFIAERGVDPRALADPLQEAIVQDVFRQRLLVEKVSDAVVYWVEGEFVEVPFFAFYHIDAQRYVSDRDYARVLASDLYQDIVSGVLTVEEAGRRVEEDARVGIAAFAEAFGWSVYDFFSEVDRTTFSVDAPAVREFILLWSSADVGLNRPSTLRRDSGLLPGAAEAAGDVVEVSFVILRVDDGQKSIYLTYEAWKEAAMRSTNIERSL